RRLGNRGPPNAAEHAVAAAVVLKCREDGNFLPCRRLPCQAQIRIPDVVVVIRGPARIGFVKRCPLQLVEINARKLFLASPSTMSRKEPELVDLQWTTEPAANVVHVPRMVRSRLKAI